MKNRILSIYIVFSLITVGFIGFLIIEEVSDEGGVEAANTLYVGGSGIGNYSNIQAAVNAANSGDTVRIFSGTYKESLEIKKSISLIGNGTSSTILNTNAPNCNIKISANWVNISGFNFSKGGSSPWDIGIKLNEINNCTIANNYFTNYTKYGIRADDSTNNIYMNNTFTNINSNGLYLHNSPNNKIKNNKFLRYGSIQISNSNNNIITDNIFRYSYIDLDSSFYNTIKNNFYYNYSEIILDDSNNNFIYSNHLNGSHGILLYHSHSNKIRFNNLTNSVPINLWYSNSNIVQNNNCNNNEIGIFIRYSEYNELNDNMMISCGILILGDFVEHWNTHSIDTSNVVNNKPVYYWKNETSGIIPPNAGEVILANCKNIVIVNGDLSNGSGSILLGFSSNSMVSNTNCDSNKLYGIYLYKSDNNNFKNISCQKNGKGNYLESSNSNTFNNCSMNNNNIFDFDIFEGSKNNIAINTTADYVYINDLESYLIFKNYLHIQVNDSNGFPIRKVDVKILNDKVPIYTTSGYGGTKPKTNELGQIKWILIPDRIYIGNTTHQKYETIVSLNYKNQEIINNERNVDMTTSHWERFIINYNYPPKKVKLLIPSNNSIINHSTPELRWLAGEDYEDDPLTYFVQIDELGDNWDSLQDWDQTGLGVINKNFTNPFPDGRYYWRVCANDGFRNGSWSNIWSFTIDTKPPSSEIIAPDDNGLYNKIDDISGVAFDILNGSGVKNVEISVIKLDDNSTWDDSGWVLKESWLSTTGFELWSFDNSNIQWVTDTLYKIRSRATDNANNTEFPGPGIIFMYDNKPPVNVIVINNDNKYTNSTSVSLSLSAIDSGSGVDQMALSINGSSWSSWSEYITNMSFKLTDGDGLKYVYFKARDHAENIPEPESDTIVLDTTPPHSLSVTINRGEEETNMSSVSLALHAIDNLSGVNQMSFSNDSYTWSSWENYSTKKAYNLPSSYGEKTVYFRVKDKAGNIADTASAKILLNITQPNLEPEPESNLTIDPPNNLPEKEKSTAVMIYWIFLIIIILIIILIVGMILIRHKKQQKQEPKHDLPYINPIPIKPLIPTTQVTNDSQLPTQKMETPHLSTTITPAIKARSSTPNATLPEAQAQAPRTQQIPQPTSVPQLQPAQH